MTIWLAGWIVWFVAVLASFLWWELKSASSHGTLSEQIWRLLGIGSPLTTGVRLRRMGFLVVWVGGFVLLSAHFIFEWL